MDQQTTILFVGGKFDKRRIPIPDKFPAPWYRSYEAPPIDHSKPINVDTPFQPIEHVYELRRFDYDLDFFYVPLNTPKRESFRLLLSSYPPEQPPTDITIPVELLRQLVDGFGNPGVAFAPVKQAYSLLDKHYSTYGL